MSETNKMADVQQLKFENKAEKLKNQFLEQRFAHQRK